MQVRNGRQGRADNAPEMVLRRRRINNVRSTKAQQTVHYYNLYKKVRSQLLAEIHYSLSHWRTATRKGSGCNIIIFVIFRYICKPRSVKINNKTPEMSKLRIRLKYNSKEELMFCDLKQIKTKKVRKKLVGGTSFRSDFL